jgi:energy-coupling factor transporter ATP-binding protein EcfA2
LIIKGLDKKSAKEKAIILLKKVGMGKRLKHRASKLSGGEKQRVVIARALASDAKILACDEPTGNLDTKNAMEIMALIKEVSKDKLVLFVTHDESLISGNATRVIKMRDGSVESDTTLEKIDVLDVSLTEAKKSSIGTLFYVALKNLLRTPKKSLFVLFVFLIVSFVILFSVAYIPLDIVATKNHEIELNMFENRDLNRVVTYLNNDFDGDFDLVNGSVFTNDYLLDYPFRAGSTNTTLNSYLKNKAKLKLTKNDLELITGRMPDDGADNEVVVILGENYSLDFYNGILNADALVMFASTKQINSYFTGYYKVVGFAYCEGLDNSNTYFYLTPVPSGIGVLSRISV